MYWVMRLARRLERETLCIPVFAQTASQYMFC